MTGGENEQDIPAGRSEQESEIWLADPDCAVTAIPGLLSSPSIMITEDGEARRAMVAGAAGALHCGVYFSGPDI
jgi:hypothetical protein